MQNKHNGKSFQQHLIQHSHVLTSIKNSKKIINLEGCSYPIIKEIAIDQMHFQNGTDYFTFLWSDQIMSIKEIRELSYPIRVNHIPDISQITRKNKLAMNLNAIKVFMPKQYGFYPETWLMPQDHHKIVKKHQKGKFYIVKPENNCQGKGIFIVDSPNKIDRLPSMNGPNMIVQEYLRKPLLINKLKFDMRIYVLVTGVNPLRLYLYKEGIARFATEIFQKPSDSNIQNNYAHLTNYAINKNNEKFNSNEVGGHKRLISSIFTKQELNMTIMPQISDIVIKTILSALPALQNAFNQCKKVKDPSACFQLLGFDIMLDQNKKAYLIEVNQNPSLTTDTKIDYKVKSALVRNILQMVSGGLPNMFEDKIENKMKLKDRHQVNNIGQFEQIYPIRDQEKTQSFDFILIKSHEIYREKFGINIIRNLKRKQQGNMNTSLSCPRKWSMHPDKSRTLNESSFLQTASNSNTFYSKQVMKNIYRTRNTSNLHPRTSLKKRKLHS